jgi:hypothetical protein
LHSFLPLQHSFAPAASAAGAAASAAGASAAGASAAGVSAAGVSGAGALPPQAATAPTIKPADAAAKIDFERLKAIATPLTLLGLFAENDGKAADQRMCFPLCVSTPFGFSGREFSC